MKKIQKLQWRMNSKIGPLYLVASPKGLEGVLWKRQPVPMAKSLKGVSPQAQILSRAVRQLEEYLGGARKEFNLRVDPAGTPFQKNVWKALTRIPYGTTNSYKDVASRIKNAKAVRAVGTANGKNPLCIIVPCHRVITHNGSLGGYSGPAGVKAKLLKLETAGRF